MNGLRRPERVLFPASGFTKRDAAAYYEAIAPVLLPHLRNRPVSVRRFPDTVDGDSFWEKDAPSFTPPWVKTVSVARKRGRSQIEYLIIDRSRTLIWLCDVGAIEVHPFLHRASNLDRPTHVLFDLDPGHGTSLLECCQVALLLRSYLLERGLECLAKVSGGKGLQLFVPLNTATTHEQSESFARAVAEDLARRNPLKITARMSRSLRAGKVFIDWSQNAGFKTTIAVYSLRAGNDRPFVSAPVRWKEVAEAIRRGDASGLRFEPAAVVRRVHRSGDLFEPLLAVKQRLPSTAGNSVKVPVPSVRSEEQPEVIVGGVRLPRRKSQSGRRLFVLPTTVAGNELWLDFDGRFRRWILRPDRTGGNRLIAVAAGGSWPVKDAFYEGHVPEEERRKIRLADVGTYELIAGSLKGELMDIWFSGQTLAGEWRLEKVEKNSRHTSWSFSPAR